MSDHFAQLPKSRDDRADEQGFVKASTSRPESRLKHQSRTMLGISAWSVLDHRDFASWASIAVVGALLAFLFRAVTLGCKKMGPRPHKPLNRSPGPTDARFRSSSGRDHPLYRAKERPSPRSGTRLRDAGRGDGRMASTASGILLSSINRRAHENDRRLLRRTRERTWCSIWSTGSPMGTMRLFQAVVHRP